MKIAAIVPTYNRATTCLPQLVKSLECQRLRPDWRLNVIIADDFSKPEERDALEQLRMKSSLNIRTVLHRSNKGLPAARNSALLNVDDDTRVIFPIDDDDALPYDSVERRVLHLLQSGRPWSYGDIVTTDTNLRLDGGFRGSQWEQKNLTPGEYLEGLLGGVIKFWPTTVTYKREAVLPEYGPPRLFDERLLGHEDLEHWIRLTHEIGPPAHLARAIGFYRVHHSEESLSSRLTKTGKSKKWYDIIRKEWSKKLDIDLEALPFDDSQIGSQSLHPRFVGKYALDDGLGGVNSLTRAAVSNQSLLAPPTPALVI